MQGNHRAIDVSVRHEAARGRALAESTPHLEVLGLAEEACLLQAVCKAAVVAVAAGPGVVAQNRGHLRRKEGVEGRGWVGAARRRA